MILLQQMETTPAVRFNSTPHTVRYQGADWLGAGNFGSIDVVSDAPGDESALRFDSAVCPPTALRWRSVTRRKPSARHAVGGSSGSGLHQAIADVLQIFRGCRSDADQLRRRRPSIGVICTHRGETFSRPKPLRNTDADQQRPVPGDTSRRFVVSQSQVQDVRASCQLLSAMRRADWQSRMAEVMRRGPVTSVRVGEHDCVTFAAACVEAVTGVDRIADVRTAWADERQAIRLLVSGGGLLQMVQERLGPRLPSVLLAAGRRRRVHAGRATGLASVAV